LLKKNAKEDNSTFYDLVEKEQSAGKREKKRSLTEGSRWNGNTSEHKGH